VDKEMDLEANLLKVKQKRMTTKIVVDVTQQLLIYCNFYFINNMIKLVTAIFSDMNQKRNTLI